MTGAVWIHQDAPEAWLVEVIPTMADDERADEPTRLAPGIAFRFPLALIAGNRPSLEAALRRNTELARALAHGEVLHDEGDASALVKLARSLVRAA
ncbi:hypothetical protein [Sorangium sp. So ce513]|uniref:hypothetical protein n=1 Tax=Sorangium sp. So ce513 TaxID=3133315 RepID=UPI003F5EB64A